MRELLRLLRLFEQMDFAPFSYFAVGAWSRRNLDAMIDDLVQEIGDER